MNVARASLATGSRWGGPGTFVPPIPLFLCAFAVALWLDQFYRWPIQTSGVIALVSLLGSVIGATGLLLFGSGMLTLHRARTGILLQRPASQIVTSGPYRWSRNPMYVSFIALYIGGALLANTVWPLILLPIVVVVLTRFVIEREERYLQEAHAESYADYSKRVRRWL